MEAGTTRTAPPEVRTRQILDAARRCFVRAGFATTKVADIASEAGVSVGLIYRLFPDKAAVMTAIVAEEARRHFGELVSSTQESGDAARLTPDELVRGLREALHDRNRVLLMLEVTTAMMRDENVRRAATEIQLDQARAVARQLAPVMDCAAGEEELGRRLQVVAGLASGFAIQIAVAPDTEAQVARLFEESATAILAGRHGA